MSKKYDRIVYRRGDGKWVNKRHDASKASSMHDTQREAQQAARQMLKKQGGGELVIKGRDGKIRSKDTIAPGNAPKPPKKFIRSSSIGSSSSTSPGTEKTSMYNPPHPGEIIREDCLKPLNLSVTKAAEGLGISRKHLSEIVNGHAGISPEMAIRLSKGFGGSPESWLKQQMLYDLWQARQGEGDVRVKKFEPA